MKKIVFIQFWAILLSQLILLKPLIASEIQ